MTSKYTTDFWQSLDLMQAGLNRKSADYQFLLSAPESEVELKEETNLRTHTPSWSIYRLWEILRAHGLSYELSTDMPLEEVLQILIDAIKSNEIES